jgi:hypothetical protein
MSIILKWSYRNWMLECGLESPGWKMGPVAGCCEHGNELGGFIKGGTFLVYWIIGFRRVFGHNDWLLMGAAFQLILRSFGHLVSVITSKFIVFVPCTVDNQFRTLSPKKRTVLSLDILYYDITLDIATCFDTQWTIIRGPNQRNAAQSQTSNVCME